MDRKVRSDDKKKFSRNRASATQCVHVHASLLMSGTSLGKRVNLQPRGLYYFSTLSGTKLNNKKIPTLFQKIKILFHFLPVSC